MKTALVTGASAGFGWAIAEKLVADGYRVIASARRLEKLEELQARLGKDKVYALAMDVSKTDSVDQALASLPQDWQEIDLLVNNAGLAAGLNKAHEADWTDWMTMIDTNIIGLIYLTRQILPKMVAKKAGQIINIGSTAGTVPYPGANVYGASKAFVKQFSLNLRADLAGTGIRVTNIEPGLCEGTEFSLVRFKGDKNRVKALYDKADALTAQDIANSVSWVASQPAHVNINRIELMPTSQSFAPQPVYRGE